ncbi:MAG: hypothetical protein ACREJ0_17770, partial [Geminicoccaceae bacterium]
ARNNPSFDLACFWQGRASRLRVKTTSNSSPIWSAKKDGTIFRDVQNEGDFVAIVDLKNGVRGAAIYIVPTRVVEEHLVSNEEHYVSHPGRTNSNARILRLFGDEKPDNRSFGYDRKFVRYLEAWDLLKAEPIDSTRGAVGRMARQLIRTTTLNNGEIAARVRDALGSATTAESVAWYRSNMKKNGECGSALPRDRRVQRVYELCADELPE